jgi:nucleotide-binding universal stress UspA family protein
VGRAAPRVAPTDQDVHDRHPGGDDFQELLAPLELSAPPPPRHANAIVVGSRGLTGIKSLLLGSVSHGLVQHADRNGDRRTVGRGGCRAEEPRLSQPA